MIGLIITLCYICIRVIFIPIQFLPSTLANILNVLFFYYIYSSCLLTIRYIFLCLQSLRKIKNERDIDNINNYENYGIKALIQSVQLIPYAISTRLFYFALFGIMSWNDINAKYIILSLLILSFGIIYQGYFFWRTYEDN